MKINLNLDKISILISFLLFALIITLSHSVRESKNRSEKFNSTKLNISKKELKKMWGKPNDEFDLKSQNDKRHIIKYTDIFGISYIFTAKDGHEIVSEKYIDD